MSMSFSQRLAKTPAMKTILSLTGLTVGAFVVAALGFTYFGNPLVPTETSAQRMANQANSMAMLDVNGDGVISPDEMIEPIINSLMTFDANKDGKLDLAEFLATLGVKADSLDASLYAMEFSAADTDKDGFLSRSELKAYLASAFDAEEALANSPAAKP